METLRITIKDPKAEKLLRDMAEMGLIEILDEFDDGRASEKRCERSAPHLNAVNSDENPVPKSEPVRTIAVVFLYVLTVLCVLFAFLMAGNVTFQHDNHTVLAVVILLILGDRVVRMIDYVDRSSSKKGLIRGTVYWLFCLSVLAA